MLYNFPSPSLSSGVVPGSFTVRRCAVSQRDFTEGTEPDSVRLALFVDAMPYKEQNIAKIWFGLGDGYNYSLSEVARIFKTDVLEMDELIGTIEEQLDSVGLLVIARRHGRD